MKKICVTAICALLLAISFSQTARVDTPKLDSAAALKTKAKPEPVKPKIIIPTPEFINQPYYYDKDDNRLIKLENATARMNTKKKALGLSGGKQFLSMETSTSKIRFTSSKNISFLIKTKGDEIDLTSFIKLYKFSSGGDKREVILTSNGGILNSKSEDKSTSVNLSVKNISPSNYMIMFSEPLEAGEYGFVWVNNMTLQEYPVYAFGIDWRRSD